MTKSAAATLAGQGFVAAARDNYPRDGQTYSFCAGFAEVEVDVETGVYRIVDYVAVADVGTVINPRSLQRPDPRRRHPGHGRTRAARSWSTTRTTAWPSASGCIRTSRRRSSTFRSTRGPRRLNIPDPGNPVVGAKGIGEPGIGVGGAAVLCALANAIGNDDILKRTPVQPEQIMTSLQEGRIAYEPLTAYI